MHIPVAPLGSAKRHAIKEFPNESCGLVIGSKYHPCENVAKNPENNFVISKTEYMEKITKFGKARFVVHSHPNGARYPSRNDMISQASADVPFAIIVTDGEHAGLGCEWGDTLPRQPLLGREFMHGVSDCYSLIRDTYAMGKHECHDQGISWPLKKINLPEVPRDDAWWSMDQDLYMDHFAKFGFAEVFDPKPGDVFLLKIKSEKLNHGGVLLNDHQILHHLPNRSSRREPSGIWARGVEKWIRHEGSNA